MKRRDFLGGAGSAAVLAALVPHKAFAQALGPMFGPGVGPGGSVFNFTQGNLIENAEFVFDQINEGNAATISSTTAQYAADRCIARFDPSTSGASDPTSTVGTISSALPVGLAQMPKSLLLTCSGTNGTSTPAALQGSFNWNIEGPDVADLGFGTANAKPLTASGALKSSITGIVCANLYNFNSTRFYVKEIPVTAGVWVPYSYTIPGDTGGSWENGIGQIGMTFGLVFAGGSTHQGTANVWQTGANLTCTANQTQFTNTANATLEIAIPKLERGYSATPFVPVPTAELYERCRRHIFKTFPIGTPPGQSRGLAGAIRIQANAAGTPSFWLAFAPPLFTLNTLFTYNPAALNANWRDVTGAVDVTVSTNLGSADGANLIAEGAGAGTTAGHVLAIHILAISGI